MISSIRRRSIALGGAGLLLAGLSAPFAPAAMAEVLVRAQGRCKLMDGNSEAFNGHCGFKHKQSGGVDAYVVKLDDGTEYIFSGPNVQALSVQTYSGIRSVQHKEQPDHDVFSWTDGTARRLSVRLDRAENPDARFDDQPQKANSSELVGAGIGALIGALISGKPVARTEPAREGAPVSDLQSLVGAKGGQAEGTLTSKGYTYRGGTKLADSSFTYWQQPKTGNCVSIRTTDGRYQAITYTKKSDCN
ncbi:hypothetical protein KBY93_09280 [Synechococcus sp. J7-Johnson]|uniref:hypothetical protein n=1 Tax=Synechococcus sp. J7-Johnson TaxID=2823737 RepID=UPI0020CE4135|nr:hypothetical protein [Synechococcus sp. J7-Johnson]MCP9840826.1 hypothetical protein [Synechococcus sp. J7-Johnson]